MGDVRELVDGPARVRYASLFDAAPSPYLVLTPELVIVEVNRAYLRATGRTREELIGRELFAAFPANPDDPDGTGVPNLRASLLRARDTGRPDTMAVQRYDIPDGAGGFARRYWSPVNVPVLDDGGRVALLLHRPEDVTDFVQERRRARDERARGESFRRRMAAAEADLYARARELRTALDAQAVANRRLAALVELAAQLAACESVAELTEVVVERGLVALGADGGAVAVRDDADLLRLTVTDGLGGAWARSGELPLSDPLPACVAANVGEPVLLPDRAAALRFADAMADVVASTGLQSWAALPLRVGERLLGSLTVGWRDPHPFEPAEVEVLGAFAAQCAQTLDRIRVHRAQRQTSETLQRSLLSDPPAVAGLAVAVRYLPAVEHEQVGGDWYDAFRAADGATTVVIGDVTGHDRAALAAMAQIRSTLRGVAYVLGERPAAIFSGLERALHGLGVTTLASAVLGHIRTPDASGEPDRAHLTWCNAGHPPPVLVPPDGAARLLASDPDPLLGVGPVGRADHELFLDPGATLVLYTDGLVERRAAPIDAGIDRLREAAGRLRHLPLEEFCDVLLAELAAEPGDDIALLALRVD
ncbi:PAS domain S-box-containing protein [Micromonospora citrea]|uniref:PAS domain S-box-containing protein n=1 Tax=Micromonospora citrea TaxID=47855 RepID=A0A1C6U4G0_9ACTN|nr:SpoIIE family protein phosphatase [Micromonospora citrea]SCL48936.1 PAS domain S-box-containing protein [Micromonospora citrea]